MNLRAKLTSALLPLALLALASCGTGGVPRADALEVGEAVDFSLVINRNWMLVEVRTGAQTITMDRENLAEMMGFDDVFTLHFEDGDHGPTVHGRIVPTVRGRAAPNIFSGSYMLGDGQGIAFGMMIATLMAALFEPEELREHEFFAHLSNVSAWNLVGGNLELRTTDEGGAETVLIFAEG